MVCTIDSGYVVKIGKYRILVFYMEQFLSANLVIIFLFQRLFIL